MVFDIKVNILLEMNCGYQNCEMLIKLGLVCYSLSWTPKHKHFYFSVNDDNFPKKHRPLVSVVKESKDDFVWIWV